MKTVLNWGSSVHGRTARPGGMQIDQAAQEPSNRTLQGRSPCTAPESGLNRPPSTRSRVDLPQPLAPRSMWKEPRGTSRRQRRRRQAESWRRSVGRVVVPARLLALNNGPPLRCLAAAAASGGMELRTTATFRTCDGLRCRS